MLPKSKLIYGFRVKLKIKTENLHNKILEKEIGTDKYQNKCVFIRNKL